MCVWVGVRRRECAYECVKGVERGVSSKNALVALNLRFHLKTVLIS